MSWLVRVPSTVPDVSGYGRSPTILLIEQEEWTLKQLAAALPFVPMQIAKITLSIPHFKTHFKEARGHTAILLWSHHASSPL